MDRNVSPTESWLNKLFKLLPAEATGLFLAVRVLASPTDPSSDKNVYIFAVLITAILPFFNIRVLKIKRLLKQNFVICISFVIWVLNIELLRLNRGDVGNFLHDMINVNFWVPALLGLWVAILIPMISAHDSFWQPKAGASE